MTLPPDTLGLLTPRNHWAEKGVRPLAGVTNPGNPGESVNRAARAAPGTGGSEGNSAYSRPDRKVDGKLQHPEKQERAG